MDGPKTKEERDFAWNAIKKAINAKVTLEVALYRERRIYELQTELWPVFKHFLDNGQVLEIDPEYENWIKDATINLPKEITK